MKVNKLLNKMHLHVQGEKKLDDISLGSQIRQPDDPDASKIYRFQSSYRSVRGLQSQDGELSPGRVRYTPSIPSDDSLPLLDQYLQKSTR